ncbi:hypothetical protein LJC00_01975 [Dysgonomonas sp. OttesenSCG-928-M03]|nr:hypothetical protein [Dysgonomonas sp. OttesenSCG-928-M03]
MTTSRVHIEISKALTEALNVLKDGYKGSSLTDIFFVVDKDSAELSIYDDEENLLNQRIIDAWIGLDNDDLIARQLREVVEQFDSEDKFDILDVYKPFSINLADENFIVQKELLLIEDDSVIRLEDDFMDRMDKEFDDFLDKLLKE